MRVTLVVPNLSWERSQLAETRYVPYNLCLLASTLLGSVEVSVLDAQHEQLTPADFQSRLRDLSPDLAGITIPFDTWCHAGHRAAALIRSACPHTRVAVGGVYSTVNPERAMRDPNIDFAFVGEADETFPQLVAHLAGRAPYPPRGVWHRNGGGPQPAPLADPIAALDALPRAALHLIDFPAYANRKVWPPTTIEPTQRPTARIVTSRGCPANCTFCQVGSLYGQRFRSRGADSLLDEIAWLRESYGIRSLTFDDDDMLCDRDRALHLFRGMVERGLAMPWNLGSAAFFHLDAELIHWMRQSGCEMIGISVESGCERVRRGLMHKPGRLSDAARVIGLLREQSIFVSSNVIIGFPTETFAEIRETIRVAEEMASDYVRIFIFFPLPGTRARELAVERGLLAADFWLEGHSQTGGVLTYPDFTASDLDILRAYEWDRINFSDDARRCRIADVMGMTPQELDDLRAAVRRASVSAASSRLARVQS